MLPFPGEPWEDVIVDEVAIKLRFEELFCGARRWIENWSTDHSDAFLNAEPKPDHIVEPGHDRS